MKFFPIVSLLFFQFAFVGAQTSLDQIDLRHGKYKVGFRHYTTFDSTRTYNRHNDFTNKSMPRPIPVSIWYPSNSEVNDLKPLKVLDYMRILAEEEEWEHLPDEQILDWFHYLRNTEENRKHMAEDAHAYFNLQPAKSKFPVVIYAPSYQASSAENFALCELLASNGYVIISSPSRGTENRKFEGGTAKDMETQARD
ncbi:MAG: alpha/beta hydrolase, partial [Bacteroidota bacterium]